MIVTLKLFILSLFLVANVSRAQTPAPSFEGEVVYANTYKSKNPKLKEKELASMMGTVHNYFVKGADYKTITNGIFAQWQLYVSKENRIYNKMISSDTVFYNNAAEHDDQVLDSKITKNATTVLGYACDELILTFRSGVHKYYYNAKFHLDAKLFVNHQYGNFYNYVSRINAVPLKMIVEDGDVTMESVATKIEAKKLPANFFSLPANTKTAPSLY